MQRRAFISSVASLAVMSVVKGNKVNADTTGWRAPAEESPHAATWMAWPHNGEIYEDPEYFRGVLTDLARLASAIARFEPVFMVANPKDFDDVVRMCGTGVTPVAVPANDMWMRDSGPVFVVNGAGQLGAVDFNFNGWGEKQMPRDADGRIATGVANHLGIPRIESSLVGEGGGLEYDGEGTLLLTDSCWLNDNRNPGMDRDEMTRLLKQALGVEKVIWLPGVVGEDITDGHIDGAIRVVRPGVIMTGGYPDDDSMWGDVLRESQAILAKETDARGRPFTMVDIPSALEPRSSDPNLFTGYANYYVANGAVFTPAFGDKTADRFAAEQLGKLFPDRKIVALSVDGIYENGGGIHCVTQQQPAVAKV